MGVAYLGYLGIRAQTAGKTIQSVDARTAIAVVLSPLPLSSATALLVPSLTPPPTEAPRAIMPAGTELPPVIVTNNVDLLGPAGRVNSLAFSPDGRLIVTGSKDGVARLCVSMTGLSMAD